MAACYSKDTILAKLNDVELDLRIVLKEKQRETIALGNDVFCCLPTGYGKSLCYALLPKLYDKLRATSSSSIVICISPIVGRSIWKIYQNRFIMHLFVTISPAAH